jgi:hypothetical protein
MRFRYFFIRERVCGVLLSSAVGGTIRGVVGDCTEGDDWSGDKGCTVSWKDA